MGFRQFFWRNWELSAGYVQMVGRYFGPFGIDGSSKNVNAELDDFIELLNLC
jgi:hypothetical protein